MLDVVLFVNQFPEKYKQALNITNDMFMSYDIREYHITYKEKDDFMSNRTNLEKAQNNRQALLENEVSNKSDTLTEISLASLKSNFTNVSNYVQL